MEHNGNINVFDIMYRISLCKGQRAFISWSSPLLPESLSRYLLVIAHIGIEVQALRLYSATVPLHDVWHEGKLCNNCMVCCMQ